MHRNPTRPLSPHLTVWRWGPHMLVSILHRVTGVGLATIGAAALVWWLLAIAGGKESYDYLAGWAKHNGCDGEPVLHDPSGPLSTLRYEGCDAEVRLVRIDGLVHAWARDEVDATREMWEFFRTQSLPRR